ncbi:MAG TPA: hypothetical protein VLT32_02325 [Candidatus Sulfomarinibacteraceae bacterium]|nr:hypothetical protein [Candidatus Sulfomarinibacteraceae bacterium]
MLDLEHDLPTTEEDVSVLRRLRMTRVGNGLVEPGRLVTPEWTLEAAAARPTFEGFRPFELEG